LLLSVENLEAPKTGFGYIRGGYGEEVKSFREKPQFRNCRRIPESGKFLLETSRDVPAFQAGV